MDVIKMEPDLGCDTGSLFMCSDIQLTAAQQADVALVGVINTQNEVIQKINSKVDTATAQEAVPFSATLPVKNQTKVRDISSECFVAWSWFFYWLMLAHNCCNCCSAMPSLSVLIMYFVMAFGWHKRERMEGKRIVRESETSFDGSKRRDNGTLATDLIGNINLSLPCTGILLYRISNCCSTRLLNVIELFV
jgi:hypothetical protein